MPVSDYQSREKRPLRGPRPDPTGPPLKNYITPAGLQRLKDEHSFLLTRERPAVVEVVAWAAKTDAPDGGRMLDVPWVQIDLARAHAKLEALKLLNWRSAWSITAGVPNMAEASAVKVMGTEFFVECYRLLLEVVRTGRLRRALAV